MRKLDNSSTALTTLVSLVLLQGMGMLLWWVAGSYLGVDVYASRILPGEDGWCNPATDGFGVHCWADYYYPLFLLSLPNPWDFEILNPYPAASLMLFAPFGYVGELLGAPRVGIFSYLALMGFSILAAVFRATDKISLRYRLGLVSAVALLSPPFLFVFDRGNSVGFLVPAIVMLFVSLQNRDYRLASISIALMSIIKPHFLFAAVLLAIRGKWKNFAVTVLAASAAHLLAFLAIRPQLFPATIQTWLSNIFGYQNYNSMEIPWPVNISFAQAVYSIIYAIDQFPVIDMSSFMTLISQTQGFIGPLVGALVIAMIIYGQKFLTDFQITVLLVSVISLTSSTTYGYYAIIAIPFILWLINQENDLVPSISEPLKTFGYETRVNSVIWLASILSLVQWPIFGFVLRQKILTTYSLFGAIWLAAYLVILFLILSARATSKVKPAFNQ